MLHTGLSRSRCAYQAATQQMLIYFFRSSLIYLFIYLFIYLLGFIFIDSLGTIQYRCFKTSTNDCSNKLR